MVSEHANAHLIIKQKSGTVETLLAMHHGMLRTSRQTLRGSGQCGLDKWTQPTMGLSECANACLISKQQSGIDEMVLA